MCLEVDNPSDFLECAHSAVEIKYEPGRGRYAIASRDIEIGTTLFRESPITYTLNPEKFGTHCQNCFRAIRGVIPCRNCTWVCFCSTECRNIAMESYHKFECGIIKLFLESGLNVYAYLVLRLLCKEGYEKIMKMKDSLENPDESSGGNGSDRFYASNDFQNVYNLMAHEITIPEEMWVLRGLVSVFILKCLKLTEFFPDSNPNRYVVVYLI